MAKSWRKFCLTTTCHGFGHVIEASSTYRALLWLLAVTVCFTMASQQLATLLTSFFGGTSDDKWRSRIYEDTFSGIPLPSIAICNANMLRTSQMRKYGVSDSVRDYIMQYTQPMLAHRRCLSCFLITHLLSYSHSILNRARSTRQAGVS